jgi:hypothetical protein
VQTARVGEPPHPEDPAPSTGYEFFPLREPLAHRLALLLKAYDQGMLVARTDDDQTLLQELGDLVPPAPQAPRAPRREDVARLTDEEYVRLREPLLHRLALLLKAYHREMLVARTADEQLLLRQIQGLVGPPEHTDERPL